jgi:hypothetical protein
MEVESHTNTELVSSPEVPALLFRVRSDWRAKNLLASVQQLLLVGPSSARRWIFSAAIRDSRDKIIIAGLDIARQAAKGNRLPPVDHAEGVELHPTSGLLDLCYPMGLLSRAEWRRLHRAYGIRQDIEHEDAEFEAAIEDCVYVFITCIQIVLAKDPCCDA